MVLVQVERLHQRNTQSRITFQHQGKKLSITYDTAQIGQPPSSIVSFFERGDVAPILPLLSSSHIRLEQKAIKSPTGEQHDYFVVRQRKRRFIFNSEESHSLSSPLSDEQRRKSLSLTLVVPHQVMQEKGYLPQREGLRRFTSWWDTRRFFRTVEKEGYFAIRGHNAQPQSIENNTDFIQPIPAIVVQDTHNNIHFTVRGGNGANHDPRISDMISAPFTMGHSQPSDFGLWRRFLRHGLKLTMYREAAEETAITKDQKTFHVFPKLKEDGYQVTLDGILRMHRYYHMKPLGVVYSENKPVDTVHAGIIFIARQRRKQVSLTLNGSSHEIYQVIPMSIAQYEEAIKNYQFVPASWNEPIIQQGLVPNHASHRRKSA